MGASTIPNISTLVAHNDVEKKKGEKSKGGVIEIGVHYT